MTRKPRPADNGVLVPADDLKQLAARINAQYGALQESAGAMLMHWRRTLDYRRAVGRDLLLAREKVGHGSFLTWLREETQIPERTAYRWMDQANEQICHMANLNPADVADRLTVAPAPETPGDAEGADGMPAGVVSDAATGNSENTAEAGEGEGAPSDAPPPEIPPAPPKPTYPHSDRLYRWLRVVAADTEVIKVDLGGIEVMLAEREKWDWQAVEGYILAALEGVHKTIRSFLKEIKNALQ